VDPGVELSRAEARRLALTAQGLANSRPGREPDLRHVRRLVARLGAVQIDSVNVLERSHYLVAYSRLGPYRRELLDRLAYERREAFEYWGHAASYLPVALHPALRWRMARHAAHRGWLAALARMERERPGYVAAVERQVAEGGPLAVRDLADPARRPPGSPTKWWSWSDGKAALEYLFEAGRLAIAGRRNFERLYDVPERVLPSAVLSAPTLAEDEAQRELVRRAATALGVATLRDLADYFRLPVAATRARIRELVEGGDLRPARVEGWKDVAYVDHRATAAHVEARTLLSPFDSLLWVRERGERLFGFRHSFELYVRPPERLYGYYVLPFLLGESIAARVDLKAERARETLIVLGAYAEPGVRTRAVAVELALELRLLAGWLGLEHVQVLDRGDLAAALRRE
jgi:uncharacterized protein